AMMRFLRATLIRVSGLKGVAEIAPALISSHKTRSTLTFAIFAVVMTLNVLVASLVATNVDNTIGRSEQESRGIDLYVTLSGPETPLLNTSYSDEIRQLDSSITDVIGLKTFKPGSDIQWYATTKDPSSPSFNSQTDRLPLGIGEFRPEQIKGNASDAAESNWRYDFYLLNFPDGIRENYTVSSSDAQVITMSRQAWDAFFDPSYTMAAYNISFSLTDLDFRNSFDQNQNHMNESVLTDNSSPIKNPIVFTDSFLLPLGLQIWLPMNITNTQKVYQRFTIGGIFDNQRAGGFPLASTGFGGGGQGSGGGGLAGYLGNLYIPDRFSQYTDYFGELNGQPA
ncbi:MAG TPA: hypothetical protein VJ044_04900, partial [Candidatus Hodarchaeales archaeon]|nr:hypothetical protein [Candidatus Hodarchaeales archaeon]